MQGRAAAVYGLVFLLVAAGAYGFTVVTEAPEPSMENPDVTFSQPGDTATIGDRTYTLQEVGGTQRGQPTALLNWTDDDARSTESWSHAAEPGGTTVTTEENVTYWVRIPQTASPNSFTLLETPAEASDVSVLTDDGNWIVNDGGEYVDLEDYDGFERIEVENGSTLSIGTGNDTREMRIDGITNESVTVSWNDPATTEVSLRQTSRKQLAGQNVTVHIPGDGTVELATSEEGIEDYLAQHDDKADFQSRMDGLTMASVLSLVSFILLIGLAFLPRKE